MVIRTAFTAAIFDLDGTLLDSMHVWDDVDHAFLRSRGLPEEPDYFEALKQINIRECADYTIARYHLNETPEALIEWWNQKAAEAYRFDVQVKPGAKEYLLTLKNRGIKLGIATSCSKELYEPALERLGISRLFDAVTLTHEVGCNKSKPDVYLLTAEKLGVLPKDCIVFEDIPDAVNGAKLAGMTVVGVYDDTSKDHRAAIEKAADFYIESFTELLEESK